MLRVEIAAPPAFAADVLALLSAEPTVTSLTVHRGVLADSGGDLISADVPRESANALLHDVLQTGVQREGSIRVNPVETWVSRPAYEAEVAAPGQGSDAVVWPTVVQRAYDESQLTFAFLSFMILATLIAAIAIVIDSQILIIGAMVVGPEFGAIAALGVALLRGRRTLFRQAVRTLIVGFVVAIVATTLVSLVGRAIGWVTIENVTAPRPQTAFIYSPDKWSFIVALIAGAAGVLAITSARTGGLVGVFISVTTIPAAGNIALAIAFADWHEMWGSLEQLVINISGMALAGWCTLLVQQTVWRSVRTRTRARRPADDPHGQ